MLLYLWWYRTGRDAPVGLIADYLPEPPSDLPAGVAGTLVDESADMQDILATILDLARRGVLEIEEIAGARLPGHRHQHRFHLSAKTGMSGTLRPYEQTLLEKLFGEQRRGQALGPEEQVLHGHPDAAQQLYDEVVSEGFFSGEPGDGALDSIGVLGAAALVAGGASPASSSLGRAERSFRAYAICVPIGLASSPSA